MERLTRPTVKVDETAAQYMVAQGCIPTDLRSMSDRLLDLVINGPTLNGVNKDVLRQLIRQLYAALKPYEDTGMEPEEIVGLQKQNDLLAQYGAQKFSSSMEDFKEINSLKLKIQSLEMSLSVACNGLNKYTQAEQEGRLVVLPCKVGDTVWLLQKKCKYAGEQNKPWSSCNQYWDNVCYKKMWGCAGRDENGNKFECEKKEMMWYAKEMQYSLVLYRDDIVLGKNLFLTHEEAQRTLEGANGDG